MTEYLQWFDDNTTWLGVILGLVVMYIAAFAFGLWLEKKTLRREVSKGRRRVF